MRCEHCKFWVLHELQHLTKEFDPDSPDGMCHRFPPVYVGQSEEYDFDRPVVFLWANPETSSDDWCGEFCKKA